MKNPVTVQITPQEKGLLDNLVKMLARARIQKLEGVEIIAAAESMRWLSSFKAKIEQEASKPPVAIKETEVIEKPKKIHKFKSASKKE